MDSSSHKLKLYQTILAVLQSKTKGGLRKKRDLAVSLAKGAAEGDRIRWSVSKYSLTRLCSGGDRNQIHRFLEIAFVDLSEMRSSVAQKVFEGFEQYFDGCTLSDYEFTFCIQEIKRFKGKKGGSLTIHSSDIDCLIAKLDRWNPFHKGNLSNGRGRVNDASTKGR